MEYNRKIATTGSKKRRRASDMSSSDVLTNEFQLHSKEAKMLKSRQAQTSYISADRNGEECEADLLRAIMGDEDGNALFSASRSVKELFDEDVLFEGT